MKCAAELEDGNGCKARPRKGRAFCFVHDPASADEADRARLAGGKQRAKDRERTAPRGRILVDAEKVKLDTKEDAQALIRLTIDQMRTGQLDAGIAHQIGYLANLFLHSLAEDEAEQRLKKLEEMTRPLKGLSSEQLLELVRMAHAAPPEG